MLASGNSSTGGFRLGWAQASRILATALVFFSTAAYALSQPNHAPEPTRPQPPQGTGIATHLVDLSPSDLDIKVQEMKAAGATWVRTDLSWNLVQEHSARTYNWEPYDRLVDTVHAHNLQVLFVVGLTPQWARPAGCKMSELCRPADAQAYSRFVGLAAERYAGLGVHSWEIWNEPNISFRFLPSANIDLYADMLKGSFSAIKAVDPTADVIAGSTAPSATNEHNYTPSDFLTALYEAGAGDSFTAVSAHPYTLPDTPRTSAWDSAWGQLETMHTIMAEHGAGNKQIWITEMGAPTGGSDNKQDYVSESKQAKIMEEATQIWEQTPWGGPLFWYEFKDTKLDQSSYESYFGLVRSDGTFKPAYYIFQEASKTL